MASGFSAPSVPEECEEGRDCGRGAVPVLFGEGAPYRQDDCADGRHRYTRSPRDGAMRCVCGKVADVTARPAAAEPPPADSGPFTWDCGPADWREAWEAWARR